MGTKLAPSTAIHLQADVKSEIANRKVEEMIRAFANYKKDNWDEHLVDSQVAYNSAVNATSLCSPFFVNYGIHPRAVPINNVASRNPSEKSFLDEIHEKTKFAHDRLIEQNKKMTEAASKPRNPHTFSFYDKVRLSTNNLSIEDGSGMRKSHPKFCGPFRITENINDVSFRLELSGPMKALKIHDVFHCIFFKPFVSDKDG